MPTPSSGTGVRHACVGLETWSCARAAEALTGARQSALLVISSGPPARLVGILTERDLLARVVAAGRSPADTAVAQVMTRDPDACAAQTPCAEVLAGMARRGYRHMPVAAGREGGDDDADRSAAEAVPGFVPVEGEVLLAGDSKRLAGVIDILPLAHETLLGGDDAGSGSSPGGAAGAGAGGGDAGATSDSVVRRLGMALGFLSGPSDRYVGHGFFFFFFFFPRLLERINGRGMGADPMGFFFFFFFFFFLSLLIFSSSIQQPRSVNVCAERGRIVQGQRS
jgi:CBS domain-containing protein